MKNGDEVRNTGRARIYYSWWGNAHPENRSYQLLSPSGELEDYGSVKHLIKIAEQNGWKYQVERWHKKYRGMATITKEN